MRAASTSTRNACASEIWRAAKLRAVLLPPKTASSSSRFCFFLLRPAAFFLSFRFWPRETFKAAGSSASDSVKGGKGPSNKSSFETDEGRGAVGGETGEPGGEA